MTRKLVPLALAISSALVGVVAAVTSTSAPASAGPCGTSTATGSFDHVVLLIFENRSTKQIYGDTTNAPYLNSLASNCAKATSDTGAASVSLPNYIALTSGYTGCGTANSGGACITEKPITSNRSTLTWPQPQQSIFGVMGSDAQELEELEPANCYPKGSQDFIINHAPYNYYTNAHNGCLNHAVPFNPRTATPDPLATAFTLLTPARRGIMHGGYTSSLNQRTRAGDDWAAQVLPQIINTPSYQAGKTVIIITWDEGSSSSKLVPLIVVSARTPVAATTSVAYNHYSVLKGIEQLLGLPLFGHSADADTTSITSDRAFGLMP